MLGILGGMGPAATVAFLDRLVRLTPAARDQDHLPFVVFANPHTPDRSDAILRGGEDPLPCLLAGMDALNRMGAGLIAIPCNTSHHWYAQMSARSTAPVLHIAQVTVDSIQGVPGIPVAVLATRGTLASQLYSRELTRRGMTHLHCPDELQELVDACISGVKCGDVDNAVQRLRVVVSRVAEMGAAAVVLGCTELSVAAGRAQAWALPLVDSTHQLALAVVRHAVERGWVRRSVAPDLQPSSRG